MTSFICWRHQCNVVTNITVIVFLNIFKDPPGVRGLGPPSKDAKPMTKQECGELWDHIFKEPRKTTGAMISAISSTVPNQYCGLIEGGFLIEVYSLIGSELLISLWLVAPSEKSQFENLTKFELEFEDGAKVPFFSVLICDMDHMSRKIIRYRNFLSGMLKIISTYARALPRV